MKRAVIEAALLCTGLQRFDTHGAAIYTTLDISWHLKRPSMRTDHVNYQPFFTLGTGN